MTRKQIRMFRRVCGALAVLSFFFALGSAGSLEQDLISLGRGALQMSLGVGGFGLFGWLAGWMV